MRRSNRGIGLIELMIAMTLGLIVVLAVTNIFISAKNTYLSQNAAAAMQEDARFVLSKMLQEIRMVGMFGCINPSTTGSFVDTTANNAFTAAAVNPINYTTSGTAGNTLTLLTGDVGSSGSTPTYVITTNCRTLSTVFTGTLAPLAATTAAAGLVPLPVRQVIYTYKNNQLLTGPAASQQVLVNNVSGFTVTFGVVSSASDTSSAPITSYASAVSNPSVIRSVRITLTLTDPNGRVRDQKYNVVATLRNRMN